MKKTNSFVLTLVIFIAIGAVSYGDFTVQTGWSIAPELSASPSWSAYVGNFMNWAQDQDNTTQGDRSQSPTAFETVDSGWVLPGSATSSITATEPGFNSWDGTADPGATFSGEYGHRIHNWIIVKGNSLSDTIALQDIAFQWTSSDNVLNLNGDFSSHNYSAQYIGVNYDSNGEITTTSSNGLDGSTQFNAIFGIGIGNSYIQYGSGDEQQRLDNVFNYIGGLPGSTVNVTSEYTFNPSSGSFNNLDTISITTIPEPGSIVLMGIALLGAIFISRKRL